jgi:hypothetical protein
VADCKLYACDAYHNAVLALDPVSYYPMNKADDLAAYPSPANIKDYSIYANNSVDATTRSNPTVQVLPDTSGYNSCSGNKTLYRTALVSGSDTFVEIDTRFTPATEWPVSKEYTYILQADGINPANYGWFRHEIDSGGSWTGCRIFLDGDGHTIHLYNETVNDASSTTWDLDAIDPDWRTKTIGYRTTYDADADETTQALMIDFVVYPQYATVGLRSLVYDPGPQHLFLTGQFNQGGMQESSLFNRALTTEELALLKAAWDRNLV